jgi:hypothetical protein
MVWPLLRRGLVCGVLAGLAAGVFAFVVGEPLVQDAIDIENASASLTPVLAHISDWTVSRPSQRGGLFLATALYGACVGTIFTLAFAVLRGRVDVRDDWQLSVRLALALFVALVLVPWLKYPANPPAVGDPDTIGQRTWIYLVLLAGTGAALVAAWRVWARSSSSVVWVRPLSAGLTFVALVVVLVVALPGVDEVPDGFPASLLWEFRLSSLGTQAVLWAALGVGYGIASVRAATRPVAVTV